MLGLVCCDGACAGRHRRDIGGSGLDIERRQATKSKRPEALLLPAFLMSGGA